MDVPSKNTLQAFVDALDLPAAWIGSDQRLAHMNPQLTALIGSNMIDRHFVVGFRSPVLVERIEAAFESPSSGDVQFSAQNSQTMTSYKLAARPVFGGVLLTLSDQTVAVEADQMRRDFIANVSHELRTPVTALSGFVETLQGAAKDDPVARARFLKIMENETERMTRLVDELMMLSRLEAEEYKRPTTEIDLRQVLQNCTQALEPIAQTANLVIETTLPDTSTKIPADFGQLQQVVTNLIENAIKYAADGGRVAVDLSPISYQQKLRAAGVVLSIRDYGGGIPEHHIARLTERFYRIDNHRSREVGGTGLGLAIVKHIISRHRGRLLVDSVVGEGSTFRVVLPASPEV